MSLSDILFMLEAWGPTIGPSLVLLAFFLWKDYRREDRLQGRIDKLEQEQRDVVLPMVEKCAWRDREQHGSDAARDCVAQSSCEYREPRRSLRIGSIVGGR